MIVNFGRLNQFEPPMMTLCDPGAKLNDMVLTKTQGVIVNHEAEEIMFNFNAISELSMRVNKTERGDQIEDALTDDIYNKILNRRLIFLEGIGFFVITNVKNSYENGKYYKDVEARSVDSELKNRNIPYIADDTYVFEGLLDKILAKFPLWQKGEIAPEVAARSRTFEGVDIKTTCYDFMMDSMQKMYECLFIFDIMNRIVNVYDLNTYVTLPEKKTNIYLSEKDIINSVKMDENAEELYTALNVYSSTDVSITDVNPLGTSCIYNFDYYIPWMSKELQNRIAEWKSEINSKEREYRELCRIREMNEINISITESEINRLETQKEYYEDCKRNVRILSEDDEFSSIASYDVSITSCKKALIFASGYYHDGAFYKYRIVKEETGEETGEYEYDGRIDDCHGRFYEDITDEDNPIVYLCITDIDFDEIENQDPDDAVWTVTYSNESHCFEAKLDGVKNERFDIDGVIVHDTTTDKNYIGEYKSTYKVAENYYSEESAIIDGYLDNNNFYEEKTTSDDKIIQKVDGSLYRDNMDSEHPVIYRYDADSDSFIAMTQKQLILDRFDQLIEICREDIRRQDELLFTPDDSGRGYESRKAKYNRAIDRIVNGYIEVINGAAKSHPGLKIDSFFTGALYNELKDYIFETDFADEDIIVTESMTVLEQFKQKRQLLANGRNKLKELSTPSIKIDVDTESFIFSKEFEHWSEQIETGKRIEVDLMTGITEAMLTKLTVNYDDHKINMEFGSDYNKFDASTIYNNLFKMPQKRNKKTDYLAGVVSELSKKVNSSLYDRQPRNIKRGE